MSILKVKNVGTRGHHLILDFWDCSADLLSNEDALTHALEEASNAAGATVISTHSHCFEHHGITAIAILAESHISIHTWPEAGYAGVDIYTCGECDPLQAKEVLTKILFSGQVKQTQISRGEVNLPPNSVTHFSDKFKKGSGHLNDGRWFTEDTVPGRRHGNVNHGFQIDNLIFEQRTQFQECLIFDNSVYGRVLVLDGIVQLSTLDEHIYHEMLVHPPIFTHPNPLSVCIIGGGDGGSLREVLRHNPEQVVMIDIDEQFVRAAEKFYPA